MADVTCKCGFDLGKLPARAKVRPEDGAQLNLSCPLCGSPLEVKLANLGILVRGSGAKTESLRWKLAAGQATGPVVNLGQFQLRFEALGTIEPREVCYPRVPVFRDENGALVVPSLPIRRAFFDCLDRVAWRRLVEAGRGGDVVGGEYQALLPLLGLPEPVAIRLPLATASSAGGLEERAFRDVNLRVWPNLPLTNWRTYLVGAAAAGSGGEALLGEKPRLRLHARGGAATDWGKALSSVQRGGGALTGALDERPAWISLEMTEPERGLDDKADAVAGGLFEVPPATGEADGYLQVGLDFGTSNTCVALMGEMVPGGEASPQLLPPVEEKRWNLYLVRGGAEAKTHRGPDLWPTPAGFGSHGDLVASELLFARPKVDQMRTIDAVENWRFGIDFGLSPAGVRSEFSETEHTLADFKWREMVEQSAPTFARRLETVQAHYIASVLMCGYVRAALAWQRAAKSIAVSYAHPISFRADDVATLKKAAETEAADMLARATGVEWRLKAGADESVAAAANAGDPGANVHVYLDMGGGSTDIAVKLEKRAGKWETVYVTSVRYAGTALLQAWEGQGRDNTCLVGNATFDVLRRRVRESRSARDVLGDPTLFNKLQDGVRRNRTVHFYGYLVEYVARMLAAGFLDQRFKIEGGDGERTFPRQVKIALFLLGNGWRFQALLADDYKSTLADDVWKRLMELLKAEKSPYADQIRKELSGIKLAQKAEDLKDVPHEKAAVAMGLLKPEARGDGRGDKDPDRAARQRGLLGWTTRVDGVRDVPWFAMYDTTLGRPPAPSATGATRASEHEAVLSFDDAPTGAAAMGPETPWYDNLPPSPSLDWQDAAPRIPVSLEQPFELDENLNMTRGALKRQCVAQGRNSGWFVRGPYEVMLEELFKKKLRTIGG